MSVSGVGNISPPQSEVNTVKTNNMASSSAKMSYSQMAQHIQFPKKEQAIVTDVIEGLHIKDYIVAIGKIVGPGNIRFASRISQGRVCLYLSTQDIVNTLVEAGTKVNIGSHVLSIRPLVSQSKRVIISNVCPIIPHSTIEAKLLEFNVKPISAITFIKAGINEAEYSHIMSFRRQMYLNPEDVKKLPSSMQIHYEGTNYWIYVSNDKLKCFLCKEEGHLAKYCTTHAPEALSDESEENETPTLPVEVATQPLETSTLTAQVADTAAAVTNAMETDIENSQPMMPPPAAGKSSNPNHSGGLKRHHSESTLSNVSNSQQEKCSPHKEDTNLKNSTQTSASKTPKANKNKKQCTQEEVDLQLSSVTDFFSVNAPNYPMNFEQLSKFLQETFGSKEIPQIAEKFTTDTPGLISMLRDAQDRLTDKTLRGRISRIVRRLEDPENYDSCASNE